VPSDPRATALLVMDVQEGVVEMLEDPAPLLERAAAATRAARAAGGARVIYVKVGFRPGYPEVHSRNRSSAAISQSGRLTGAASAIHHSLEVQDADLVVDKKRVSAFAGSDLELLLRAGGIETLALCGIATSGVVLSTVRVAADLDYALVVLADACADRDPEVHRVLLEKVFPRQADVVSVEEWTAGRGGA
jgi:nicotinamidase-related amidase